VSEIAGTHHPGVLTSLANERNELAWQRTALSWVAAGGAAARYFSNDGLLHARAAIGWLMIATGVVVWWFGRTQYRRRASSIRNDRPTTAPSNALRVVWGATTLVSAFVLAVELSRLPGPT
jgi:uncharacterized membrane protein YidH (DUF202 family)